MDYRNEYINKNPGLHLKDAFLKTRQILKVLSDFPESKRILDVGCGAGAVTIDIAKRLKPEHIEGLDVSEAMINKAKELDSDGRVYWRTADIFDYHPKKPFDLIICADIIEHVKNDDEFLRRISMLGKRIVLRVPLEGSYFSRFLRTFNIFDSWQDTEKRYGHLHHYNEEELIKKFAQNGLVVVKSFSVPMPRRSKFIWEIFRILFYPLSSISMDLMIKIAGGFKIFDLRSNINL